MPADAKRLARFVAVGLIATAVHYMALFLLVETATLRSIGLANLLAASLGIATSFLGNHRVVFRASAISGREALPRFLLAYSALWLGHGGLMLLWADWLGWPYQPGFVLITGAIAVMSYRFNVRFVFRAAG